MLSKKNFFVNVPESKAKKDRPPIDWENLPDNALMLFNPTIESDEELAAFKRMLTTVSFKYDLVKLTFAFFRHDFAAISGGHASAPLSCRVLKETRVFELFNKLGVSLTTVRCLHSQTFHFVSKNRSLMTMDLYCRQFMPRFVGHFEKIVHCPGSLMPAFLNAFVCMVFRKDKAARQIRCRALNEFTVMNPEFFKRA